MNLMYSKKCFEWNEIINTPLSLDLARIKAPQSSDKFAADQIATALHEAIHFIYAVWFDIYVDFAGISTRRGGSVFWKGYKTRGMILAYDYNAGWPAIYSTCAAALFELELKNRSTNELVWTELEIAFHAAKYSRWPEPHIDRTADILVRNTLRNIAPEYRCESSAIGQVWWLIRSVAIALLISRTMSNGLVSNKKTQEIRKFISKYIKSKKQGLGEWFPEFKCRDTMTEDIKWLRRILFPSACVL